MGWIDVAEADIPTDKDHATKVETSKAASSTLLFAKSGKTTVYQREEETVTEYRGLTETSARGNAGVTDSTTQTAWYGTFGSEDHSITATTGTRTVATAARANEARGWTLTVREVAYSTYPEDLTKAGWAQSRTASGAKTRTVSHSKSANHVQTWSYCSLFQTKETTVTETTGLTEADAQALIDDEVAKSSFFEQTMRCAVQSYVSLSTTGSGTKDWTTSSWCWAMVQLGTIYYGSARKVSDAEGWSATITKEAYGWTQAGNGQYKIGDTDTKRSWVAA